MTRAICGPRVFLPLLAKGAALSLLLAIGATATTAQDAPDKTRASGSASAKIEGALYVVAFKLPEGQIRVLLPADLRAGDTVLGTADVVPKGKREADKDSNRSKLNGYMLSLAGDAHAVQSPVFRWSLPADLKADDAVLIVTNASREETSRAVLPLDPVGTTAGTPPSAAAKPLPTRGRPGQPIVVNPSLFGGTEDLHVLVGGKEARLLAASPRAYIVESPRDAQGKTTLQLKRGTETAAEGKFSNNRASGGNPWPYIIVGLIGVGIYIAVQAASFSHDFGHIGGIGPF